MQSLDKFKKKDFFIDCRVYLNLRSHFKLIEDNNTVYWQINRPKTFNLFNISTQIKRQKNLLEPLVENTLDLESQIIYC